MIRSNVLKIILGFIDVLVIALAFQCSYIIRYFEKGGLFFNDTNLLILFIGILPFWILMLYIIKKTGIPTRRYKVIFILFLQASITIYFLLILLYYIFHLTTVSRLFLAEISLFGFLFLYLLRILTFKVLKIYGNKGHNLINIVILADDSSLPYIENTILNKPEFKIVVMFSDSDLVKERFEKNYIILPEKFIGILNDLVEVDFVDEVLYLKQQTDSAKVRELLISCEDLGIILRLRHNDPKISLSSAVQTEVVNGKFLTFINIPNNTFALAIKKTLDINIALLLIVVLSPVIIAISILIILTSKGPIINKIPKIGWRGRNIELYRFRTTYITPSGQDTTNLQAEIENKRKVSEGNEIFRVTNVGRFLIKSGLDMLPMLINVLKGEISVTGLRHPLHGDNLEKTKL